MALAWAAATAAPAGAAPVELPQDPQRVFARYVRALATLRRPKALTFDYRVEQLGPHDLEQTHRVYRAGRNERDETLFIDGNPVTVPVVRIMADRTSRYDVGVIAPRPKAYAFRFQRTLRGGADYRYVFTTVPAAPRAFSVREIVLDERSALPARIRFTVRSHGARGAGELRYGGAGRYWLVQNAEVTAHLPGGKSARERIAWSNYQFPPNLPASTFTVPKAHVPVPVVTPTATPTPAPPPGKP